MTDNGMTIYLTHSQVTNLAEFFEFNFIDSIRNDAELDNIDYVVDMCKIYSKLKEHLDKIEIL